MIRLVIGLAAVLCAVGHADEGEAKMHYDRAMKAYNALQDFRGALHEFQAAYVEKPDPAFLFNIAQCQRQLGAYEAAARSYRAFLNQAAVDDGQRNAVESLIRQMDEAARIARANQPPTGTTPPQTLVQTVPPAPKPWYKRPAGMTLTAGGVAVAVVGGALLGKGAADFSDARHAATLPRQQQLQESSTTYNTAGWVVLGVGGAALIAGIIVLVVGR